MQCHQPVLDQLSTDQIRTQAKRMANDLYVQYISRGQEKAESFMSDLAIAAFEDKGHADKGQIDQEISLLSGTGLGCEDFVDNLQLKLNEFETKLQCLCSSLFVKWSSKNKIGVPIANVVLVNGQRKPPPTMATLRDAVMAKFERLIACADENIAESTSAARIAARGSLLVDQLKKASFETVQELCRRAMDMLRNHLDRLRYVCILYYLESLSNEHT